jgi:hypothetical protein
MSTLERDLREVWRPSAEQITDAAEFQTAHPGVGEVLTAHLLVGKHQSFWTEGIEVVPVPGVFTERLDVWETLARLVAAKGAETGKPVTGGYTYHFTDGGWAVFEDISSYEPEEG